MKRTLQPWEEPVARSVSSSRPGDAEVLALLENILESPQFRTSRRCQQLLRFLVENVLRGRKDLLKERTIGVEVFARTENYEPSEDSIVRVNATDVRKRLAQYYLDHGKGAFWIDLPPGSYVPEFHRADPVQEAVEPRSAPPAAPAKRRNWTVPVVAAVLFIAVVAAGVRLLSRPAPTDFDRFWEPVAKHSGRVLICSSVVPAIDLSPRLKADLSAEVFGNQHELRVEPGEIGFYPEMQMTRGNFLAVLAFSGVADRLQRPPEIRLRPEVSLEDRRARPVIMIGAFSNPTAMDLNRELRFRFERWKDGDTGGIMVTDQQKAMPQTRIISRSNYYSKLDYALLTRVFDPSTHQVLIWAGGMSQFGTQAAAEFATNPIYWVNFGKTAPNDWEHKNLQVVLEVSILNQTLKTPKVIATHFW